MHNRSNRGDQGRFSGYNTPRPDNRHPLTPHGCLRATFFLIPDYLGEILQGGAEKVLESGAVLVGGHSIQDDVPKYGLSVMGLVHPNRIYKNFGCKKGDVLILTRGKDPIKVRSIKHFKDPFFKI